MAFAAGGRGAGLQQINFIMKLIMKHIARKAGFEGDTSRDYEFTNWPVVDGFVADTDLLSTPA